MRLHEVHRIEDMKSMPGAMHPGDVITSKTTRLGARGSGPAAALPQQVFTARGDRHDDTGVCCPGHRMSSGQKASALVRASAATFCR
jgi:hypothetical protein